MKLQTGEYTVNFENGGLEVSKNGDILYFNHRPVWVKVKDYGGICRFRDVAYEHVTAVGDEVLGVADFTTDNGSVLKVQDTYSAQGEAVNMIGRGNSLFAADLRFLCNAAYASSVLVPGPEMLILDLLS